MEFETEFRKCFQKELVQLNDRRISNINLFADKIVEAKKSEYHHVIDGNQEHKRFVTGLMGESAVENFLGIRFMDWSIGNSIDYNVADLRPVGLNIGVKTVEYGKFPVIHKKSYRPEIICVVNDDHSVYVCGVARVSVLNEFQSDDLILSSKLRARNIKSGFYGFDKLIPFHTLEELKCFASYRKEVA